MNKNLAITNIIVIVILALAIGFNVFNSPNKFLGGIEDNRFTTGVTSSSVWVGKDIVTTVLAANSARQYALIQNISGATSSPTTIYCSLGGTPSLYSGLVLYSTSSASDTHSYEITPENLYTGAISCISFGASSTVTKLEK